MMVRLLFPDVDVSLAPTVAPELVHLVEADLGLDIVYDAMADGDGFLRDTCRRVLLHSLSDPDQIAYRQHALADCIAAEPTVRELYQLAVDAGQVQRSLFLGGLLGRDPSSILHRAVQLLGLLTEKLAALRDFGTEHAGQFHSAAFTGFWATIADQLDDVYLSAVRAELAELSLPRGAQLSLGLGPGNTGIDHRLHRTARHNWWARFTGGEHTGLAFTVDDRDEAGSDALTEIAGRAVNSVANTATQAADHIQGFFGRLRFELGFYLGCVNLHRRLGCLGVGTGMPIAAPATPRRLHARDLRDIALCLSKPGRVVGNDLAADGAVLVVVTGANEGGKSTFLRSLGSAQLMMQAGMFVTAESLTASVCTGVYTHFKREEDATMARGKLDEELARMSAIADSVTPGALLLCNESFASTTEREGSQIARGVIQALTSAGITVVFVTHMFDLADSLYRRGDEHHLFLRAQRRSDTSRTFHVVEAAPKATSHGLDSFARVFGEPARLPASGQEAGVDALNITVAEIDMETVGLEVTIEGNGIDAPALVRAIERVGAAVHSIDGLVVGTHIVDRVPRTR